MSEHTARLHTAAAALTWAAVGSAACILMIPLEPNLLEEGLMLHVAQRLVAGEHLYRDIELVTGPVPYGLVAGAFAVLGESVAAARTPIVGLHALASSCVFLIARAAGVGPWAHAAAAAIATAPVIFFPLLFTAFYTTIATALVFPAAWLALRGMRSPGAAFAAGVAVALVALSKQTLGVTLAALLAACLATLAEPGRRARLVGAFAGGGAATAAATLLLFAWAGDLEAFARSMTTRPSDSVFGLSFVNLWPPGELAPELRPIRFYYVPTTYYAVRRGNIAVADEMILLTQVMFVFPFVALAATGLRRLAGPLAPAVWVSAAVAAALLVNLVPRPDSGHIVFAAPAALAHAFVLAPRRRGGRAGTALGVLAAACALGFGAGAAALTAKLHEVSLEPWSPRLPQRPVTRRTPAVKRVLHYLDERIAPGEPIYVARAEPLVYFATGARNPTRFTGALQVWGLRHRQQDEILAALEDVRFVVMSDLDEALYSWFRREQPRVQEYLERHFHLPSEFTGIIHHQVWMQVLVRGRDRGPTAIDLADPALGPQGVLFVGEGEEVDGPPPHASFPTRLHRRPVGIVVGPAGGAAEWEIDVPPRARLQASIGLAKVRGVRQPNRLRLRARVIDGTQEHVLFERRVIYGADIHAGRTWQDLEADLSEFAGRTVRLRLEARGRVGPGTKQVAWWGSPRIALAPAEGE